jgi:hypothetical protein
MRPDFPGTPRGQPRPETTPIRPPFHRLTNCATGPFTFSDAIATVRYKLWVSAVFETARDTRDRVEIPRALLDRLTQAACFPA